MPSGDVRIPKGPLNFEKFAVKVSSPTYEILSGGQSAEIEYLLVFVFVQRVTKIYQSLVNL